MTNILPEDSDTRKRMPITTGVIDYFPRALAAVAEVSRIGNDKHNPGEPLHWVKEKSTDHADCIARHLIDRGKIAADGSRHSAALAWRALALLEMELEGEERATEKLPVLNICIGCRQHVDPDYTYCPICGSQGRRANEEQPQ